ncbi:DivIVA domain-containing protein [Stackebrandtia albiflava]|uniref:DivIVA domain-containing protein n=1 Tax=Stackebrandtia albiflava TaxID=406432 RepID=A0A562V2E7_9ACTN|nr:DivIVA domain-containing protein [Stackebrandtia albiflava]TWJ12025.1 DivIVA domain-containing protein [Stackebrandtia albiflava]
MSNPYQFPVVLRGYDPVKVDEFLAAVEANHAGGGEPLPPPQLDIVLRGYDRTQVDDVFQRHGGVATPPRKPGLLSRLFKS